MANVRITSRIIEWSAKTDTDLDITALEIATDIHRESSILAPKDSRNLVNSGRIARKQKGYYSVIFGDDSVPYARRRHFENKKNPGTLLYLEKPGDNIARNIKRYLRKI